ncbi:hypothetical protein A3Q56_04324 [Intoshia linei]|uniref:Rho GTPase-activating protein 100F n=1 Tax=Intoshia linei TaxID=1819745 RepID=A0A177B0Y1_9BILA|nr:hypothetical protein A3Q56_04324 [Intoshia linei]
MNHKNRDENKKNKQYPKETYYVNTGSSKSQHENDKTTIEKERQNHTADRSDREVQSVPRRQHREHRNRQSASRDVPREEKELHNYKNMELNHHYRDTKKVSIDSERYNPEFEKNKIKQEKKHQHLDDRYGRIYSQNDYKMQKHLQPDSEETRGSSELYKNDDSSYDYFCDKNIHRYDEKAYDTYPPRQKIHEIETEERYDMDYSPYDNHKDVEKLCNGFYQDCNINQNQCRQNKIEKSRDKYNYNSDIQCEIIRIEKNLVVFRNCKYRVLTVKIVKRPGQSVGFFIRQGYELPNGESTSENDKEGISFIYVSRIKSGSAIEQQTILMCFDRIVSINSTDTSQMDINDVVVHISTSKVLVLEILRNSNQASNTKEYKIPREGRYKTKNVSRDYTNRYYSEDYRKGLYTNYNHQRIPNHQKRSASVQSSNFDKYQNSFQQHNYLQSDPYNTENKTTFKIYSNYDNQNVPPFRYKNNNENIHRYSLNEDPMHSQHRMHPTEMYETVKSKSRPMCNYNQPIQTPTHDPGMDHADFTKYKSFNINENKNIMYSYDSKSSQQEKNELFNKYYQYKFSGRFIAHILMATNLKSSGIKKNTLKDLYCVVQADGINKARTMIRTGISNFDWNELFGIDVENCISINFLLYNWHNNERVHRLLYCNNILLSDIIYDNIERVHKPSHFNEEFKKMKQKWPLKLALLLDPIGSLYITIDYIPITLMLLRREFKSNNSNNFNSLNPLFGNHLSLIVKYEDNDTNVPIILRRLIHEIENRNIDHIGIYTMCGSERKRNALRNSLTENVMRCPLTKDYVIDTSTLTDILKDFLRELAHPVMTVELYPAFMDSCTALLQSNRKKQQQIIMSLVDCLPQINKDTLSFLMNHIKRVEINSNINKSNSAILGNVFGSILFCPPSETLGNQLDVLETASIILKKHSLIMNVLIDCWSI